MPRQLQGVPSSLQQPLLPLHRALPVRRRAAPSRRGGFGARSDQKKLRCSHRSHCRKLTQPPHPASVLACDLPLYDAACDRGAHHDHPAPSAGAARHASAYVHHAPCERLFPCGAASRGAQRDPGQPGWCHGQRCCCRAFSDQCHLLRWNGWGYGLWGWCDLWGSRAPSEEDWHWRHVKPALHLHPRSGRRDQGSPGERPRRGALDRRYPCLPSRRKLSSANSLPTNASAYSSPGSPSAPVQHLPRCVAASESDWGRPCQDFGHGDYGRRLDPCQCLLCSCAAPSSLLLTAIATAAARVSHQHHRNEGGGHGPARAGPARGGGRRSASFACLQVGSLVCP